MSARLTKPNAQDRHHGDGPGLAARLAESGWSISAAARQCGYNKGNLSRKLRGIDPLHYADQFVLEALLNFKPPR